MFSLSLSLHSSRREATQGCFRSVVSQQSVPFVILYHPEGTSWMACGVSSPRSAVGDRADDLLGGSCVLHPRNAYWRIRSDDTLIPWLHPPAGVHHVRSPRTIQY